MDNNMPTMADLSTIYGSYSPEMYMQGQRQINQSNQIQDQSIQKGELANMFTAQNNPQLLEKQRLDNEGTGFDNRSKRVKAEFEEGTAGFKLDEAKRQQVLNASDHEIKMMANQAQQMAYSPDPAVQAKGKQLMMMSAAAVEARQKHKEELEKQDVIRKSAERVAAGNNAATIKAAQIAADSRVAAKSAAAKDFVGSIEAALLKQKIGEQFATLNQAAIMADNKDEPALAATFRARAAAIEPQVRAAMAAAGTNQTTLQDGAITNTPRGANVPSIAPPQQGAKPPAIKSLADLSAIYPNVPPEKLREAYKKKFGVDIQ